MSRKNLKLTVKFKEMSCWRILPQVGSTFSRHNTTEVHSFIFENFSFRLLLTKHLTKIMKLSLVISTNFNAIYFSILYSNTKFCKSCSTKFLTLSKILEYLKYDDVNCQIIINKFHFQEKIIQIRYYYEIKVSHVNQFQCHIFRHSIKQ